MVRKRNFDKIKKGVDDSVNKNLEPKLDGKRISLSLVHLQSFLQDILNGKLNYIKEVKKYYSKNVYDKYEKKENLNTKSTKEMVSFYDQVRTIFSKPSFPVYEADEQPDTTDMPE